MNNTRSGARRNLLPYRASLSRTAPRHLVAPAATQGQLRVASVPLASLVPGALLAQGAPALTALRFGALVDGDLRPLTAIPGLVDVHTHMTWVRDKANTPRSPGPRSRDSILVLAQENARNALLTSVTTVRDLNAGGACDACLSRSAALPWDPL